MEILYLLVCIYILIQIPDSITVDPPTAGNGPAVLYLPLGGGGVNECEPAAGSKLTQLVPLMFAGMTFTIFDAVANINNNLNSNNNNNNNQNLNFQQSINTVVTGNINVANQINVAMTAGKKRRKRETGKLKGRISEITKLRAGEIAKEGLQTLMLQFKLLQE